MKKIFKAFIFIAFIMALCACANEKVKDEAEISQRLQDKGFIINDVTAQMDDKRINSVVAANNGKYQIEYYVFNEEEDCKEAYESNKQTFEVSKTKGKEKNKNHYLIYTQKLSDTYNVIIKDDKTLIYSSVNIEYKKDLNKVLKHLGY